MKKKLSGLVLTILAAAGIIVWAYGQKRPAPGWEVSVARDELRFSGERAHRLAVEFATSFPCRHSGAPNNAAAARWVTQFLTGLGCRVETDYFRAFLYGRPTVLRNVQAVLPGKTEDAVVVVAHIDQARTTVQGADNNASGIGIMLHLAEIFAQRDRYRTLVFLASNGEEYGMLGARRFLSVYPRERVVAAVSLDNVGRYNAIGLHIAAVGQGRGYTDLWLARLVQQTAEKVGIWRPTFPAPVNQVVERAVPFSFTDQGPFLYHGVPAFDLGVTAPSWPYYHTPEDTADKIAPFPIAQAGLLTEAVLLELDARKRLPPGQQVYLYFNRERGTYLPSSALHLIMLALLLPLFRTACKSWREARPAKDQVLSVLARLALNALPLLGGLTALYALAAANLIPRFSLYPAPPRDPVLYQPAYSAVAVFLAVVIILAWVSRRCAAALPDRDAAVRRAVVLVSLSLLSLIVFAKNGFALLLLLPCNYLWPLIRERKGGAGRALNAVLLPAGGVVVCALLYFFAQVIYVGWYMWWYFLQMLAFRMIAPYAALAGIAAVSCGLTLAAYAPARTARTTRELPGPPTGPQRHSAGI
jgi:hypothetical protein